MMEAVRIPPFESLLPRASGRGLRLPRPPRRARAGGGRVPGDVPARAAWRTRRLRARRAPACVGAAPSPRASASTSTGASRPRSRLREDGVRRLASRVRRARAPDRTASRPRSARPSCSATATTCPTPTSAWRSARARRRRARPRPRASGACAKEDRDRMTVSPQLDEPLPRRSGGRGPARRRLRRDRLSDRRRSCVAVDRPRPVPDLVRRRHRRRAPARLARPRLRRARPTLSAPPRRGQARARRVLRRRASLVRSARSTSSA